MWHKIELWIGRHSSELIGAGLMLSSSGLDGVYMMLWMPSGFGWLGLVLNTMSDVADLYLGRRVGSLIRSKDEVRRWGAFAVFVGQLIAVLYSWFYGWRRLLTVLPAVEPEHYRWIAPVAAGFIPLLLAVLGIESGLSSFSSTRFFDESEPQTVTTEPDPLHCPICGATTNQRGDPLLTQAQLSGHMNAHTGNGNGSKQHEMVNQP